jgi:hypothetical protein
VCVLLRFDERFCVGIDGLQCVFCWNLMKDYVLELMVCNVCVLLEFDERLCAGIDYCMCVFCWTFVTYYILGLIVVCVCVCSC